MNASDSKRRRYGELRKKSYWNVSEKGKISFAFEFILCASELYLVDLYSTV